MQLAPGRSLLLAAREWRIALWVGMLALIAYLVWQARGALLPFAVGAVLAYTLTPIVDRMSSVIPARSHRGDIYRRAFAVLVLYVAFAAAMFAAGAAVVPVAVDQIAEFVDTLPELVESARQEITSWVDAYRERVPEDAQDEIDSYAEDLGAAVASTLADTARSSIGVVTNTLGVIVGFAIVPFWLFYALRDRHNVSRNFQAAVPAPLQEDVEHVLAIADRVLGRYIRAQLILGLVVGAAVAISLTWLDVQLSIALGVFAGIAELIPIIGPWLGALPAIMIVLATEPDLFPWVAGLFVLVQQLENNLLVPRVQGHATDLHPAMILILLAVAGTVFGLWGLIAVVPAVAILREVFWYVDRRLQGQPARQSMARANIVAIDPSLERYRVGEFTPPRDAALRERKSIPGAETLPAPGEAPPAADEEERAREPLARP